MEILNLETFLNSINSYKSVNLDLSKFYSYEYECSCGKRHVFCNNTEILAKSSVKILIVCPENDQFITYLYVKPFFLGYGFKCFETLCGVQLDFTEHRPEILKQTIKTAFSIKGH